MLGLPSTTEVKRPLPKAQLFKRFDWKPSQRDSFDNDVSRLDFVNWISPRTLPAIAEGEEVKELFVIQVSLKRRDFDSKSIMLLAKCIPQRVIYALRFGDKVQLAVYHTKLFIAKWQNTDSVNISISGLNFDTVWQNIVTFIADMELVDGNSLVEQIKINEQREKVLHQIAILQKEMRSTSQTRKQREIYCQIKKLKSLL